MTKTTRILGSIRLSVLREDSAQTGVDKQRDAITDYARVLRVEEIDVLWAEDTNVSGSKSPFERPGLGPWLTDPELIAKYDVIVAAKLDRLGRNARDLQELRNWVTDNGKRMVVTSLNLEWPAASGIAGMPSRIMWELLGELAQAELEAISERFTDTRHWLRDNCYWDGRKPLYGYRPVCACHGLPHKSPECENPKHHVLAIHDDHAAVAREIALRFVGRHPDHPDKPNGESFVVIAEDLNRRGIPSTGESPKRASRGWTSAAIGRYLANPGLMGYVTHQPVIGKSPKGKTLYQMQPVIRTDPHTGMGMKPHPPILDQELWELIQDTRVKRLGGRQEGKRKMNHLLTGIIECPCGHKMYYHDGSPAARNGTTYAYYVRTARTEIGHKCPHRAVRVTVAEDAVNQWIEANSYPITERRLVSGGSKERSIADINAQMARNNDDREAKRISFAQFVSYADKLNERLIELESSADDAPQYEIVPTGKTLSEEWASWPVSQRSKYLKDAGIKVIADREAIRIVTQ